MNFQTILMPKKILVNSKKKSAHLNRSYLKYALDSTDLQKSSNKKFHLIYSITLFKSKCTVYDFRDKRSWTKLAIDILKWVEVSKAVNLLKFHGL